MKAQAPSEIMALISCMAAVPGSARRMYLIKARAKRIIALPPIPYRLYISPFSSRSSCNTIRLFLGFFEIGYLELALRNRNRNRNRNRKKKMRLLRRKTNRPNRRTSMPGGICGPVARR